MACLKIIRPFALSFTLIVLTGVAAPVSAGDVPPEKTNFRISQLYVPRNLDPAALAGSAEVHMFHNLYRGLYIYRVNKGLVPIGAKSCDWSPFPTAMTCTLNPQHRWSDGQQVVAEDYVRAFRRLVDPRSTSREANELSALKNYRKILESQLPTEALGIQADGPLRLKFAFDETDVDFKYRLASPILVPFRKVSELDVPKTWLFNGPYELKEWKEGQYAHLSPSAGYLEKNPARPSVEFRIIDDGTAALNLYQTGFLDFVPMIPTAAIPEWRNKPGFFETSIPRFDFIGFGPALKESPQIRKAISLGSDFKGFQKLFQSKSRPGCPGFPVSWTGQATCLADDATAAKKALAEAKQPAPFPLTYYFTQISTDDLKRGAEFYQQAWKRNLDLSVDLQSRESGVYRKLVRENPPPIFRRGIALDRPTCLAALERFESKSPDNDIRFEVKEFDQVVEQMRAAKDRRENQKLCRKGLQILYARYALIPQGEYFLGRIKRPEFKGVEFTSQGSMDLTTLRYVPK